MSLALLPAPATEQKTGDERSVETGLLALLRMAALSRLARPARFAAVGGLCALLQLAFLFALSQLGMPSLPANVVAYLLSAQANFVLSDRFIWHDRRATSADPIGRRWLSFHLSIAGTFLVSQAVFLIAVAFVHYLLASALGIALAAVINFAIQDRLTFRAAHAR